MYIRVMSSLSCITTYSRFFLPDLILWTGFGCSDKAETVLDIAEEVAEVVEDVAEAVEKAASQVSDNLPGAGMLKDAAEWVEDASEDLAEGARLATNVIRKVFPSN